MNHLLTALSVFLFVFLGPAPVSAQLAPGDIMFVAFNLDSENGGTVNCGDGFAFVCLAEIPANTTIYFTEDEYNGGFDTGEGDLSWTSGSTVVPAGTVVQVFTHSSSAAAICGGISATTGSVAFAGSGSWGLSATNEEIYAYTGALRAPTVWLTALLTDDTDGNNVPPAALSGFVVNTTAADQDADLGIMTGGLGCSTKAACVAAITNVAANWTLEDDLEPDCCDANGVDYPRDIPASFSLTPACVNPTLSNLTVQPNPICADASASVTFSGSAGPDGQWQLRTGGCNGAIIATAAVNAFTISPSTTTTYYLTAVNCDQTTFCQSFSVTVTGVEANAGPDQLTSGTSTTLQGNSPGTATGTWSILSGSGGTIANPGSPTSNFTGVAGQDYELQWSIDNGACGVSTDAVKIAFSSPTTLSLGDLVFTEYVSTNPDYFTILLLDDILVGTEMHFTERGWLAAGGFRVGEGTLTATWHAAYSCGSQFHIRDNNPNGTGVDWSLLDSDGNVAGTVVVTGGSAFQLSVAGDQIFAYQDSEPTAGSPSNFRAAIQMNGNWDTDAGSTAESAQPAVFANNAGTSVAPNATTTERDNAVYNCTVSSGSPSALRVAINTPSNWSTTDTRPSSPTFCTFGCQACSAAPTIDCSAIVTQRNNDPGTCGFTMPGTGFDPVIGGGCGTLTLSNDYNNTNTLAGETFPIGTTTVAWTVMDENGQMASCPIEITIVDAEAPTAVCIGEAVDVSVIVDDIPNASNSPLSLGGFFGKFGQTFQATATGPLSRIDVEITSTTTAGVITLNLYPGNTDPNDLPGTPLGTASFAKSDPGGATVPLIFDSPVAITTGTSYLMIVTATGEHRLQTAVVTNGDPYPNGTFYDFGINTNTFLPFPINDIVLKTYILSPGATSRHLALDAGGNAGLTTADLDGGSSDACGGVTLALSPTTFTCSNIGAPVSVTLTVTDGANLTAECTVDVTVVDPTDNCVANQPPVASCQNLTVQVDANCQGIALAQDFNNNSSDPNTGDVLSYSVDPVGPYPVGVTQVTLTVSDGELTDQCEATLTVQDSRAPTALCQNVTVQLDAAGSATLTAGAVDNGSNDACGIATTVLSQTTFGCANVGQNTVTLTVTDVNGNFAGCTATVTAVDNAPPDAVCQNITVNLETSGIYSLDPTELDGGSTDNCGAVGFGITTTVFDCDDVGETFAIELTVSDNAGNFDLCTANVTVVDNTDPSITCVATPQVRANDPGECFYTAQGTEFDATATDNCGNVTITDNFNNGSSLAGAQFPVGTTTVTFTATDNAGNTDECTIDITVTDNEDPVLTCQDATFELDATGNFTLFAESIRQDIFTEEKDNCAIEGRITFPGGVNDAFFDCEDLGSQEITLGTLDVNGNEARCTFTLTITDPLSACCQPPVISCPGDVTISCDESSLPAFTGEATFTEGCGDVNITYADMITPGDCPREKTITRTWTATDENGDFTTCDQTITVVDETKPTVVCDNTHTVQLDGQGDGSLTAADVYSSFSDNCSIDPASLSVSKSAFDCNDVGTQTVTLTATDDCGNSSECTATVTVADNVAPVAICQNVTVQLDAAGSASLTAGGSASLTAGGSASLTAMAVDNNSSDACGIADLSLSQTTFGCADVGPNEVTLTVTDVNGNSAECTATVTVEDNVVPTALCQNVTVQLNASGVATTTAAAVDNNSSDACGIADLSLSPAAFGCADVGPNEVTLTVTDVNGNSSECSATVTVADNVAPVAICQNVTVQLNASGVATTTASAVDNGSSDACGIADLSLSPATFGCADVGPNAVTLTVTDNNDNPATCSATVTVEDNVAPTALCQNVTVQLNASGVASLTAMAVDNGSSDACGVADLSLSPATFGCVDVGPNEVTLTVTDVNGNSSECTATVTVEDNVAPTALCQNVTVQLDAAGSASLTAGGSATLTAGAVDNNSSDACGIADLSLSQTTFGCADVGPNEVTLTVTDVNGNSAECTATVTVEDNVAPTITTCTGTAITFNGEASFAAADFITLDAADNCGIVSTTYAPATIGCESVGQTVSVLVTVTDAAGNSASCTAEISVGGLPCGFTGDQIDCAGDATYESDTETFEVTSDGCYTRFRDRTDEVALATTTLCGDGSITAFVEDVQGSGLAGVFMRETLDPGSKVTQAQYSDGANQAPTQFTMQRFWRTTTGAPLSRAFSPALNNHWVRISRAGNKFRVYRSSNGTTWKSLGLKTINMADCIQIGLVVGSRSSNSVVTARFTNVTVTGNSPAAGGAIPLAAAASNVEASGFGAEMLSEDSPRLYAYPNPTVGRLEVRLERAWEGATQIEVLDGLGRRVLQQTLAVATTGRTTLDLSGQPAGVYYLRITGPEGERFSRKVILLAP